MTINWERKSYLYFACFQILFFLFLSHWLFTEHSLFTGCSIIFPYTWTHHTMKLIIIMNLAFLYYLFLETPSFILLFQETYTKLLLWALGTLRAVKTRTHFQWHRTHYSSLLQLLSHPCQPPDNYYSTVLFYRSVKIMAFLIISASTVK